MATQYFRDVIQGTNSTSNIILSKPALTEDGDILMAAFTHGSVSASSVPSGWTAIRSAGLPFSQQKQVTLYYKIASSEPSTWTWGFAAPQGEQYWGVIAYKNSTIEVISYQDATTGATIASLANTSHQAVAVTVMFGRWFSAGGTGPLDIVWDAALTPRAEVSGEGGRQVFGMADQQVVDGDFPALAMGMSTGGAVAVGGLRASFASAPVIAGWSTHSATYSDDHPHVDIPVGVPVDVEVTGDSRDEGDVFVHDQHVHAIDPGEIVPYLHPPGLPGERGTVGATGPTGPAGLEGIEGNRGAAGTTGVTGPIGAMGEPGEAGLDGPPGPPAEGAASRASAMFTGM